MGIAEKEQGLSVFDTDILNTFFSSIEITAWPLGKIGARTPVMEGLMNSF